MTGIEEQSGPSPARVDISFVVIGYNESATLSMP